MNWKDEVLNLARDERARVSLLLANADTGETLLERGADARVISASTIKVAILLSALEGVQRGEWALAQKVCVPDEHILSDSEVFEEGAQEMSIDHLLRWMIITSDNTATNALIRLLTMERINAACARLGLTSTRVERLMLDFAAVEAGRNNYTSARDQCAMFCALHRESILTPALCRWALEVLRGQRCKGDFFRYIPENLRAAHKTGSLDGINHDSGLFELETGAYYLGVFVTDAPVEDENYGKRIIGRIARRVYGALK